MKYRLSDCVEIVSGGTPKKSISEYWNGKIPWLTIKDFNLRYPKTVSGYITNEGLKNSSTRLSEDKDILISARGTVGEVMMIHSGYTFNQSIYGLRVKRKLAIPEYVYYWLIANKEMFSKNVHGSVFDTITRKTFDYIKIELPSIAKQNEIIRTLDSIDAKIELNYVINDNLKLTLTTIFESQINSFGFDEANLTDIATYKNGLAMQKYRPKPNEQSLPVLKIKELNQGYTDTSSDRCSAKIDEDVTVHTGDIIFSWSGTLLVKNWSGKTAGLNQHLFKVTSKNYPDWFIYEWTKHHLRKFQSIAAGKATTMGHIKRSDLASSRVIIPDKNSLAKLDAIMKPLYDKRIEIIKENQRLIEIKKILLQKYF